MASQVISFRLGEDALAKLAEKSKKGESPSQAAQRLLNDLLGTTKEIEITEVDSRIQEALLPIKQELAELKAKLKDMEKSEVLEEPNVGKSAA